MNPLLAALVASGVLTQEEAERIGRLLDPDAARLYAERVLMTAMQTGLMSQEARLLEVVRAADGTVTPSELATFWQREDEALWRAVEPALAEIATDRAVAIAVTSGLDSTWHLVNEQVIDWAQTYYANADVAAMGSIPNLNLTSRTRVLEVVTDWQRGELQTAGFQDGLPELIRSLEPIFGPERAEAIGVTEVTRIFSEATRTAAIANPNIAALRVLSAADERVCPICGPVHGQVVRKSASGFIHPTMGNIGFPPFHVRCRCHPIEEAMVTMNEPLPDDRFVFEVA